MADEKVTVKELRERAAGFVRERDWGSFHNPKDLSIALSVEASELLERFLWAEPPAGASLRDGDREAIADELADVLIYALHLANALGLDLSDAVMDKFAKSAEKYPTDRFRGRAP